MDKKKMVYKLICGAVVVALVIALLTGLLNGRELNYHKDALTGEDVTLVKVDAPTAVAYDGTINADAWNEIFPYITASMKDNAKNDGIVDYLEQDPYLVNIYEGFGFAKEYGSARGHSYTLDDVNHTARPHPLANCLTCKTPNFAKLVQDQGVSAYKMDFQEVFDKIKANGEAISCYTCHGNSAGNEGELRVTHMYVNEALGANAASIDPATLSCGQCHIEYYFTPADKETMMPYGSVEAMDPEAILAFYDSFVLPDGTVGFSDWTQESTGAKLLKAQHPEMETYLLGQHAADLSCADCHMEVKLAEDGTVYHSHEIVSPLSSKAILETCVRCHGDTNMIEKVHRIQDQVTARETEIGNKLSGLKDGLAAANAAGSLDEETLNAVRKLYREAQWFFDFCYVENAEGAHNSSLANRCLDLAAGKIAEASALLPAA
ncbi:MAG: ammonia-forming cytochrome c nitrite reductase subunit c552 [Clostridia bacterium]|nr:ammonia-forming cytochrome c nitrite reductase subunit c552 [Clostridia bacterium]MBQ6425674.1 ammonia-forming cytochrome c nitrite reductase subunit c552 [Clostridia bacterium]